MKKSTLLLCFSIAFTHYFWTEAKNLVTNGDKKIGQTEQSLFVNKCIEDLGCFYTGPPFFDEVNRPTSLPPTGNPKVKFYLFTPANPDEYYNQEVTVKSLEKSPFDPKLETKFLIHGFLTDVKKGDVRYKTKDAFLRIGRFNVFIVDWTEHNGFPYEQAVANTRVVGALVAKLVYLLMNETGIDPQSVHIIGHSLGAHTSGYAGERIVNFGRISGLDPAGPYFQDSEPEVRLDRSDALFVDIIHTDGAGLGMSEPIGHMDFYPNGGHSQPGCANTSKQGNDTGTAIKYISESTTATKWISNACDHSRANDLFLDSIDDSKCRFLAVHCPSYSEFEKEHCPPKNSTVAEMGYHAKKTKLQPPVKFYLRTNGEKPSCQQA